MHQFKVHVSVHWRAQCHAKWARSCRGFHYFSTLWESNQCSCIVAQLELGFELELCHLTNGGRVPVKVLSVPQSQNNLCGVQILSCQLKTPKLRAAVSWYQSSSTRLISRPYCAAYCKNIEWPQTLSRLLKYCTLLHVSTAWADDDWT